MRKRLKLIAILTLLCGLSAAAFAAWSYLHARSLENEWPGLQEKSVELEQQSDRVKGTAEESRLMHAARDANRAASETLAAAKSNSQRAVICGVGSILLILISIACMFAYARNVEAT